MKRAQEMVREFMLKAEQECPNGPRMVSDNIKSLRCGLIDEEREEYNQAKTITEVADAIADMLYVVLGTAVAHGIDIDPIFQEVHRSNMSKFIDGYRREDGKWVKGPSYKPADFAEALHNQVMNAGAFNLRMSSLSPDKIFNQNTSTFMVAITCNGRVHYRRPANHPDVWEAWNRQGYKIEEGSYETTT